jgi:hypothetical protein
MYCTGGDEHVRDNTLSGIVRVRRIHSGYPCTGEDVWGEAVLQIRIRDPVPF